MGKKVKKKARSAHKDRRVSSESPRAPPVHSKKKDEIGSDGVLAIKERKQCTHFDKGVDLTKLSSKIGSLESVRCEDCREGALDRKASKGRSKHGKKKSLSSTDAKSIWVCLECGHFACGGVGLPTTPQTHAVRHARKSSHPCVIQFDNPHLRWCYPCNSLIPIEKSEDNNEQKDLLLDAVKLIRGRSSEGASTDVGDVWSEGGSVGTEMKSESVEPTDLGGEGGYVVRGLLNLGNTCFFNSVMQNLLAMKSLRDYFMKMDSSVGPVTMALKKLFIETSPGMESRNVINPRTLFGCICANAPQFKGYQQQDSHELLCYLLDGLCTEELGERKLLQSSNEGHPSNPFDTFVDFIFGGQLSSTVCCKECGHSSTVYEPFLDLSLPVPTKKPPSKKVHPVPRTRKPKLPPKKGGKARMKGNSDATPRATGPSESFESSSQVLSSVPVANEMLAQQDNNVWLDFIRPSTAVGDNCSVSQNCSVSAIHDSENKQDFQSVADQAVASVNDFSWLDYVEPGIGSDNHLCISQNNDATVIQDSVNNQFIMNDHVLQDSSEQCSQVSLPHRERNMELCSSLANCEDELPLQVQDSEVLLLPYKEENVTANEMVKEEGEASSSIVVCQQDSLDFDGFGDLFNEPDMVSVPTKKPLLGDKDIEPNEITEKGFSLRNSSDSDPEEVDNTNAPVSIDSCLAYFTRPELLADEHAWHCESCSKSLQNQNMEARNIRLETKSKTQRNGGVRRHNIPSGLNGDFPCSEELKRLVNKKTDSDTVFTATAESLASQSVQFDDSNQNVPKNCQNCMGTKLLAPTSNQVDYDDVSQCGKDLDELNHASQEQSSSSSDYLSCSQASFCDQVGDSCSVNEPNSIGCKLDQVQPRDSQFLDRASKYDDNEDVEMDSESVKVKQDATKRILISKAPPILTIHLKRFSQDSRGRLSKLSGHVDFKDTIDLKPYTVLRNREGDKCDYRLVGVVEHSGTMRGGHYVAYIRGKKFKGNNGNDDGDSTWYYVSDTHVRETSLEEVLHCEAYILFYERI